MAKNGWRLSKAAIIGSTQSLLALNERNWVLTNQIWPTICEDSVVEFRVCGGAAEVDIAGIGVVYKRWLKRARGPPHPTVGTRAESKAEDSGSRADSRKAVKRSSAVVAVFNFDRLDRDDCPTCPEIRETIREKLSTSTTTTGRTIMGTIQREKPATSAATARDQTPTTATPQPGAAQREATPEVPALRPPEEDPAVLTSEDPRQPPRRRCLWGLLCWGTSWDS